MTMPNERLQAIAWGRELLHQVAGDESLPGSWRSDAAKMACTFPTQHALEERVQEGAIGLPDVWSFDLLDAYRLFEQLSFDALGSQKTRDDLRFTLRHYPDAVTIRAMSWTGTLGDWMQPARQI